MLLTPQPASSRQSAATAAGMRATRHTLDLVFIIGLRFPFIAARGPLLQPTRRRMHAAANPSHLRTITVAPSHLRASPRLGDGEALDGGREYPLAGERVNPQASKSPSWSGR